MCTHACLCWLVRPHNGCRARRARVSDANGLCWQPAVRIDVLLCCARCCSLGGIV